MAGGNDYFVGGYLRGPKRGERNLSGSVRRVYISLVALPHPAHGSASIGIDSPQFLQRRAIRLSFIVSP
jgi:hypothetical protein